MHIEIVGRYIQYLKSKFNEDDEFITDPFLMQELLRQTLCVGLGLPSTSATKRVNEEALNCAKELLSGFDIAHWSEGYKKGLLEACMHCIVMTTKVAERG